MKSEDVFNNRVKAVATIAEAESIAGAVRRMEKQRQNATGALPGIAAVVSAEGMLVGAFSDGDLRRAIAKGISLDASIASVMNAHPISVAQGQPLARQLESLTQQLRSRARSAEPVPHRISHVLVVDSKAQPRGALDFSELSSMVELLDRRIAVVGMGYVGFTLSVALSSVGYHVVGVERDARLVRELREGRLYIREDGVEQVFENERKGGRLTFATELPESIDVVVVAVGTPVDSSTQGADYTALLAAADAIGPRLRHGSLVVLRSTVSLGTTRDIFVPALERKNELRAGTDYHVAFAPERTIEGAALQELRELPQVVGGLTDACVERTCRLFSLLSERTVPVDSLEAAEAVKLANNTFRDLSFAFANEIALMCAEYNIDAFRLIAAANDGYPRSRIPMPSPGVGGYCLTKDPLLFSIPRSGSSYEPLLGKTGRQVNERALQLPLAQLRTFATQIRKRPSEMRVLLLGMAFKGSPENSDLRGSTAVDIFRQLRTEGFQVQSWDLAVSREQLMEAELSPWARGPLAESALDAVLILNNHVGHRNLGCDPRDEALSAPVSVLRWVPPVSRGGGNRH